MIHHPTPARKYAEGIGDAVADRTVNRIKPDGTRETWADVAYRVALGNSLLNPEDQSREFERMHHHLRQASILMSGRHLQHGDETQPTRNQEVFTNCSTAATSHILFYLLLNGSGVGRSYDDNMIFVDWRQLPPVIATIDADYPDRAKGLIGPEFLTKEQALEILGRETFIYEVEDSREGWAHAVEYLENLAYHGSEQRTIIDFSKVRPYGSPIRGMQNRPSSGPAATMKALAQIIALSDEEDMEPWCQAMHVDHYLAESVLVGGARRAARMATKDWRDESVLDFIKIKQGGKLWSSNNSVMVDAEFWRLVRTPASAVQRESQEFQELWGHAKAVFDTLTWHAYHDMTGEPGLINADKLTTNMAGFEVFDEGDLLGSSRFKPISHDLHRAALAAFKRSRYKMITNPCVTADTWIHTAEGPRRVAELIDKPFTAIVNGSPYAATGFWKTGDKQVFKVTTDRGYELRVTDNHKLLVEVERKQKFKRVGNRTQRDGFEVKTDWIEVKDLQPGDTLVLSNHIGGAAWDGRGTFDEGWLVGSIVGDGGHNPDRYPTYLRFWGEQKQEMAERALELVKALPYQGRRPVDLDKVRAENNGHITVASRALDQLVDGLIEPGTKTLLPEIERTSSEFYRGFLRGFFDADGSVQGAIEKGVSVRLGQSDLEKLKVVQRMLARLGIISTIYEDRRVAHERELPDGKGGTKFYECKAQHELVISRSNLVEFMEQVGFSDAKKAERLAADVLNRKRSHYAERFTAEIVSIEEDGVEAVYDCTVEEAHCFDANGIVAHNCGEITLTMLGGYCVIADVVPYHAADLDDAEDAFRTATRALIRTNLMDCLYRKEVDRTNRIGVGITGLHEFAFKFFGYGFRDIIDEDKSKDFWLTLSRFKRAVVDEAFRYSCKLGVTVPHTDTTIKPAGTTSKLFGLSEGAHLPAMREYLRFVQFRNDDPLIEKYRAAGYPVKQLVQYSGTTVVGFPTAPEICKLGMGDKLVTASEATPEEQYQYLRLLEKYWIRGVDEEGVPLPETGNQVSYTLKYDPKKVTFDEFRRTLLEGQSTIRCCSVMPQVDTSAYEYQPETPISKDEFDALVAKINGGLKEEVGFEHVDCASGACPIDFKEGDAEEPEAEIEKPKAVPVVFSQQVCPACDTVKKMLREAEIEYVEVPVNTPEAAAELWNLAKVRTVPVIAYEGQTWVGVEGAKKALATLLSR